jgi:KEOPS complex subunit Cgi121
MEVVEGVADVADVDAFVDDLARIGDRTGVAIQAFDARYVVGREHLARAVELADRAVERGDAIARDRSVEILLYAAGRRQIDRALTMGVDVGEGPVAIAIDAGEGVEDTAEAKAEAATAARSLLAEQRPTLAGFDEELVADFFDVGPAEREAADATLADLVCERVALLAVEK